jgi:hypothetical protein
MPAPFPKRADGRASRSDRRRREKEREREREMLLIPDFADNDETGRLKRAQWETRGLTCGSKRVPAAAAFNPLAIAARVNKLMFYAALWAHPDSKPVLTAI